MKLLYLCLIINIFLANCGVFAQTNNEWFFEDYHSSTITKSATVTTYVPNGYAFTPKGDMRILIICAGFGEPYDSYGCGDWDSGAATLPDWVNDKSTFYNQYSDFSTYASQNNNQNISRFYYEMSMQQLRLIADIYPTRINIDPMGSTDWYGLTRKVFEKMKADDPDFDWSNYDNRENYPNYDSDNSNSQPDDMPDFVVVLFRYSSDWSNQPISGMQNWAGSRGGYAAISGLSGFNYNGYSFHSECGYTHCSATSSMYGLFIHELAHTIFQSPHYASANSIVGKYFYGQNGWGMMNLGYGSFGCALGWERWYLDWIDLTANGVSSEVDAATDLPTNGEFILRDFITTGDVIRIKLNNGTGKNQYLWLENHQGESIFENRGWTNNGCGVPFPSSPRGLVAYIESINDNKNAPNIFDIGANGIKYINADGNYNYSYGSSSSPCNLWGNLIYNISEGEENPISGQNGSEYLRFDFNNNNVIYINEGTNSISSKNEQHWLVRKNGNYTYDLLGHNVNFEVGDKIGMSTNPILINRPLYNQSTHTLSPFYLNGISVSVVQQYSNGNIKVRIQYNDVDISRDITWAGKIYLPDITGDSNPDVIITEGKTLLIDKSGTANRHTKINGEFINPTEFYCEQNSLFKLENNANLTVDNGSSFIMNTGSELEIVNGAEFYIKLGAILDVQVGATIK